MLPGQGPSSTNCCTRANQAMGSRRAREHGRLHTGLKRAGRPDGKSRREDSVAQDKAFRRIGSLTVELNEAVSAENPL